VLAQALWALYQTSSLTQGLDSLLAVNASPSVLATYGALAGALYGYSAIPSEWCEILHRGADIDMMAQDLCRLSSLPQVPSPQAHSSHPPSLTNKGA
jgi:ADP-ribosyl-[dinitrogen reductase] hydrolase